MAQIKVGDKVYFKKDVEGSGIVAEIISKKSWDGRTIKNYLVKSESEPNGYRFHPEANFDHEHFCMVVFLYADQIWK